KSGNLRDKAKTRSRRRSRKEAERRRHRIALVHELARSKKPISKAEIARRVGFSRSTVRRDLCREPPPTSRAQRDLAAQARVEQRQQRAAQVRALRDQGLSLSAIARRLGISCWTVQHDLSERPKKAWRRPELVERDRRARELYASGGKVPDIAAELGVSPS